MSNEKISTQVSGTPLRIHELNIEELANYLYSKKIYTTQGKRIQPLHSGHLEVVNDPARYKVLAAGRRYGKTLLCSLMALAVFMQPNRRVWICAPSYDLAEKVFRELYNILVNQLKLIIPGKKGSARQQKGDYFLQSEWGSVIQAKSMESPDSLAGEANDLVIIDEAAIQTNLEDIWIQMLNPTLIDKEGSAIFISTPRGKNSFFKMFLMGELGRKQREGKASISFDEENNTSNDMRDWSSFKRTSYDNPLLASSPEKSKEELDTAYRRAVLSGKLSKFKQEYLADFESVSDSCFPEFVIEPEKENVHPNVVPYKWHPDNGLIFAACDHNYAKPASTIFAQVDGNGDVVIFDEKFTKRTSSFQQAEQILEKQRELHARAVKIWQEEGQVQKLRKQIAFEAVIADISGDQVQLNGRKAWDDFESVLKVRPVGLKQDRETGCNMIRLWLRFPQFDSKGRVLKGQDNEQITYPKLFISDNCINLIYALNTAVFKKGKNGNLKEDYEETPEGHEGLLDALRYLLVYLFHDRGNHVTIIQGVQ